LAGWACAVVVKSAAHMLKRKFFMAVSHQKSRSKALL
jgi:hypothetical protein